MMIRLWELSSINSRHDVLPPYRAVEGPGQGIEPLTPQNFKYMSCCRGLLAKENLRFLDLFQHHGLHGFQGIMRDADPF